MKLKQIFYSGNNPHHRFIAQVSQPWMHHSQPHLNIGSKDSKILSLIHCTITLPSLIFIQGSQELYHIPFPPGQILPVDARQHGPSRRYRDCESIAVKGNLHPAQRHEVIGKNLVAQATHQLLENGFCEIMNDAYCDFE